MITSGIIVFALGILGCCGAYRELKCMLGLYIGLIVLVIFVTVAACAVTFLYRDEPCYGKLKTWMEEQVHVMGGVVIAMIVLEVLAIVFAVLMIMPARKNTDYLYRV
nr:hypothetical protein BaRGS_025363 [Batillaria attramentaria]